MPRILLVEDVEVNRNMLRDRLTRRGFEVVTAETGEVGLQLAASAHPALVLMDLGLPGIDGWEATRRLKANAATADIPVIALSAHATAEAKDRAAAVGCEDFETKPPQLDVLVGKIHALLAGRQPLATPPAPQPPVRGQAEFDPTDPAGDEIDLFPTGPAGSPSGVRLCDPPTRILKSGPVLPPPPKPLPPDPPMAVPVGDDAAPAGRKRILVVEDNDPNRVMLARRLNRHGFDTAEACDGREALAAVHRGTFDLVLLDIMMPEMDGFQVLQALKADPALEGLPVIMISALDEMASVVKCIELGAEDYLTKPYDPVLLQARINACLDKRRLRDQELAYLRAVADLTQAAAMVEAGAFDPAVLGGVSNRDDALGRLARVFEKMAREVQARVTGLEAEVQRLRVIVEIDEERKKREVADVTEGEFFQDLQQKAAGLRRRFRRGDGA